MTRINILYCCAIQYHFNNNQRNCSLWTYVDSAELIQELVGTPSFDSFVLRKLSIDSGIIIKCAFRTQDPLQSLVQLLLFLVVKVFWKRMSSLSSSSSYVLNNFQHGRKFFKHNTCDVVTLYV